MRFGWLVLGIVCFGCTAEDASTGTSGPVALEDYCEAIVESTCRWQAACGCDPSNYDCAEQRTGCQNIEAAVAAMVEAGTTTYDGMATRRHADRIAAATCDQTLLEAWGFDAGGLLDFAGEFRGRLPPGSACTAGNLTPGDDEGDGIGTSIECADGVCLRGRCAELRGVGEPCDATVFCFDYSAEDWDFDKEMYATCSGTCQPLAAVGSACVDNSTCASYRCDTGVCVEEFGCAPGTSCGVTDLALGVACARGSECASDACNGGVCVVAACSRP